MSHTEGGGVRGDKEGMDEETFRCEGIVLVLLNIGVMVQGVTRVE